MLLKFADLYSSYDR